MRAMNRESTLLCTHVMVAARVSLIAQPPCDVYLNDPSMTPCVRPNPWDFNPRPITIRVPLPPNYDTCDIEVRYVMREYEDTCTGEEMWEYRILFWVYLDCPAYQAYADSLRDADPERYRQIVRQLHGELSRKLNELKFITHYNDLSPAQQLLFHCTEPPPSCAKTKPGGHYISAFVSTCVEFVEARSFGPTAPLNGCWYCFISPCTVSKCCFLHQVYCWDTATNSPRMCSWWTFSGNTVECGGESDFNPQQAMPDCPPPYMIIWRSGCQAYECP
jgi:hypothetical protein